MRVDTRRRVSRARRTMAVVPVVVAGLVVVSCSAGGDGDDAPRVAEVRPADEPGQEVGACAGAGPLRLAAARRALLRLEDRTGARVGVHALHTGTELSVGHRADERFGYASTVKLLTAAALLDASSTSRRQGRVTWSAEDLVTYSPITETRIATGMTVLALMRAAVVDSDNTAANLILEELGGPAALQRALTRVGDTTTTVTRYEPELNDWTPGQRRDTTTPRALAHTARAYLLGDVLRPADRELLWRWLRSTETGLGLVRAGVPAAWQVGDKSGTAAYGTRNDVAIVRPPASSPLVVVVMTSHADQADEPDDAVVAAATRIVISALCGSRRSGGTDRPTVGAR